LDRFYYRRGENTDQFDECICAGEQAWAKFDVSSITAGATITSVTVNWYINARIAPTFISMPYRLIGNSNSISFIFSNNKWGSLLHF